VSLCFVALKRGARVGDCIFAQRALRYAFWRGDEVLMRVRHRIPSIFTLSMVDVLCCALGCVILLWLLNLREAKEHEDRAGESARQGAALLADAVADRDSAYALLADLNRRLEALEADRDRARARLTEESAAKGQLDARLTETARRLATLESDAAAAELRAEALKSVADSVPALRAELKATRDRFANEEAQARALEKEVAKRSRELTEATKTLQVLQAARQALERDVAAKERELTAKEAELAAKEKELEVASGYKARWAASAGRVAELEKLTDERGKAAATAKQAVELLEEEKKALRAEAARYRQSADNRFAGIQLTGRRVVFLVDMSGSMELVDETTAAPLKWTEVRQTLVKIMRSLPFLHQYQLIVFSEQATLLFGNDDRWLDYDPGATPEQVLAALANIKPKGGTNMYTAFDAAFRFRSRGLDTIYLFSDGLPNLGEGITAEQSRTLKEVDQSEILGKYIRRKLRTDWNVAGTGGARVRINAVGFFYESPDVGAFLWALARENEGSFVGMSKP
jgi:hypothetical protein